jgi:hypothetical protein
MKYCVRCGRPLDTCATQCGGCGLRQPFVPPELLDRRYPPPPGAPNPPPPPAVTCTALVPVYYKPLPRHKKGVVPFLIWSILLIPFFNPVGTPLGIISAFLCLAADANRDEKNDRKLSAAAILCIVATVIDVITLIALVLLAAAVLQNGYVQ